MERGHRALAGAVRVGTRLRRSLRRFLCYVSQVISQGKGCSGLIHRSTTSVIYRGLHSNASASMMLGHFLEGCSHVETARADWEFGVDCRGIDHRSAVDGWASGQTSCSVTELLFGHLFLIGSSTPESNFVCQRRANRAAAGRIVCPHERMHGAAEKRWSKRAGMRIQCSSFREH